MWPLSDRPTLLFTITYVCLGSGHSLHGQTLDINLIWPYVRFIELLILLRKIGGRAPEDVILELIRGKCLPA